MSPTGDSSMVGRLTERRRASCGRDSCSRVRMKPGAQHRHLHRRAGHQELDRQALREPDDRVLRRGVRAHERAAPSARRPTRC